VHVCAGHSVVELVQEGASGLSVLRTVRLLRLLKLVRFMPALYLYDYLRCIQVC